MTNAEIAAHFAALPPDETAEIAVVDLDTGAVSLEDLVVSDEYMFEDDELTDDVPNGKVCIIRQW